MRYLRNTVIDLLKFCDTVNDTIGAIDPQVVIQIHNA